MGLSIVKQLSGSVLIVDFTSKLVLKELTEDAALLLSNRDQGGGIWIIDKEGSQYFVPIDILINTQILPNLALDFSGDARAAYELLETDFFYNLLNPPSGGGVQNIYNTNGTLTANRTLTGSNFSLSLLGLNSFLQSYNLKEETIGAQKLITMAYEVNLVGNSTQTAITIPLDNDFDSVEVFGRTLFREDTQTGIGRDDFFGSCTRNSGGTLELDNVAVQAFRRESIAGNRPIINHDISGTNYLITINPRSNTNIVRFRIWLEVHFANITP